MVGGFSVPCLPSPRLNLSTAPHIEAAAADEVERIKRLWGLRSGCGSPRTFKNSMGKKFVLQTVAMVTNAALESKFEQGLSLMQQQHEEHFISNKVKPQGEEAISQPDLRCVELFHGTSDGAIAQIVDEGFSHCLQKSGLYGRGTYLSEDPLIAAEYSKGDRHLFCCRVLLGVRGHDWELVNGVYSVSHPHHIMPTHVLRFAAPPPPVEKFDYSKSLHAVSRHAVPPPTLKRRGNK
jgi:hypothetical protein